MLSHNTCRALTVIPALAVVGIMAAGCTQPKEPSQPADSAGEQLNYAAGERIDSQIGGFCKQLRRNLKAGDAKVIKREDAMGNAASYVVQRVGKTSLVAQQFLIPSSTKDCKSSFLVLNFDSGKARKSFLQDDMPDKLPKKTSVVSLDAPGWGEAEFAVFVDNVQNDSSLPDSTGGEPFVFGSEGDVLGGGIQGHILDPQEAERVENIVAYTDRVLAKLS